MRIDVGQYMRMQQQMKLTPRMIQAMEILQLPALALEERIEQEMSENPLLEMAEDRGEEMEMGGEHGEGVNGADGKPLVVEDGGEGGDNREDFQRLGEMSEQYGSVWEENTSGSAEYRPGTKWDGERDGKMDAMANTAARPASLTEQLLDQWRFVEVDERMRKVGELVIGFIDEDGYLRADMDEILNQAAAGVRRGDVEEAIKEIQRRLEPVGIGARDLKECLLLQIDAKIRGDEEGGREWRAARMLVEEHLKDIELNRLPRISGRTGLTLDQIKEGLGRLRRLDPHPGKELAPERREVIIPDVIVEYDPVHDVYVAGLNRGGQPGLRINPRYQKLSKDREQTKETRDYLAEKLSSARWLIDSLEQRETTLLRVVRAVVEVQREFLDHGIEFMRPLPMVQVADQLGIHVGTVSRAVSGKYIQTPRGIYALRMFFSGGTESEDGEGVSWGAVAAKLKEVVEQEDPKDPLSDDQLMEEMKKQGITIARRTVSKYRQQLGIETARKRKQY